MGEGDEARYWQWGAETCSEPLCPSLQGPPTAEDFSEVMTQVQEVGGPRLLHGRGRVPSLFCLFLSSPVGAVGVMACFGAFRKGVATLSLLH